MTLPQTIGILGFGEVGRALARGFIGAGARTNIIAVDAGLGSARGPSIRQAAAELGVDLHEQPGAFLSQVGLVFSAVTGKLAVAVAEAAVPHLKPGAIYLDVNTATPTAMRETSQILAAANVSFADIAIMGAIDLHGHRTPMLASGPAAAAATTLLEPFDFHIRTIDGAPGDASAIKLLRSVFTKGLEALCVEAFTVARHFGLDRRLMENLADFDQKPIADTVAMLLTTHCRHAGRRRDEVRSLAGLFAEAGMEPRMTPSTESMFSRTVESDIPQWANAGAPPNLEACLDRLTQLAKK